MNSINDAEETSNPPVMQDISGVGAKHLPRLDASCSREPGQMLRPYVCDVRSTEAIPWLFPQGRPALLSAPLEGISDEFWRDAAFRYGCDVAYTEMVSADALARRIPQALDKLKGVRRQFPTVTQIFGRDPQTMAEAAILCEELGGAAVDINFGCPVPKMSKHGWGAALMREPSTIREILAAVRNRITIPLWIKIRQGWDHNTENYLEIAKIGEGEGIDAIALHGRTRALGFKGRATWEGVAHLKTELRIPVFGSGDVTCGHQAAARLAETDCDGILIGRGALGSPWVFREVRTFLQGRPSAYVPPSLDEIKGIIIEHLEAMVARRGEHRGVMETRKHFAWYTRGLEGSKIFRARVYAASDLESTIREILVFFDEYAAFIG